MFNNILNKAFIRPELKHLSGKYYSNMLLLVLILVFSMSCLGIGKSIMTYMSKKMESPFISYIYVNVPSGYDVSLDSATVNATFRTAVQSEYDDYKQYFSILSEPKADYRTIKSCKVVSSNEVVKTKQALIKRTESDDPLISFMKTKGILPNKFSFTPNYPGEIGCVVKESYLKELGYEDLNEASYLQVLQSNKEYGDFYNPIPIKYIVSSLPDGIDILMGNGAFNICEDWRGIHPQLCCVPEQNIKGVVIPSEKNNHKDFVFIPASSNVKPPTFSSIPTYISRFKPFVAGDIYPLKEDPNYFMDNKLNNDLIFIYDYYELSSLAGKPDEISKEIYSVKFNPEDLTKVADFNSFLTDYFGLKIDMRVIEDKNNFNTMNKITQILSYSLILLSILSIVVFKTSLFTTHISQNRKNLGTLKAFGIANNEVIKIYSYICMFMIIVSFALAFVISRLIGGTIVILLSEWFGIAELNDISYRSYPFLELVTYFIILPLVMVIFKLFKSLNDTTPGDLIYDR